MLMKTSKQIQIKRGEVAEEFMKGLERMDIVTFDRSQLFEETSKYNYEHEKFKPILNEGCLIFSSVDDEKIHLFFKVQEVDGFEFNIAELDFLKDSEWVGKYKFVFWPDTSIYDDYEYDMVECETAETLIYTKQNNKIMVQRAKETATEEFELYYIGDTFMALFEYFAYLLKYPELKRVEVRKEDSIKGQSIREQKNNASRKKHSNGRRIVYLNGIKIETKEKKVISKIKSKKREYICGSWNVRAHLRHLKDGRIVHVSAYEKGRNRNTGTLEKKPTTYVIG